MPVQPAQYQWRPDDHYQQWNVCDDCLFPLADALQYRVETWHRPPRDEEDDSRPDYGDILQGRFYEAFDRPLDHDLQRFDFARALIWLNLHAPSAAVEAQRRLDALRDALDPDKYGRDPDLLIVPLADTAWYFRQLAQEIRATTTQPPKDQGEQPQANSQPKGNTATVAARMIDLIKDPATHTWTAEQFRQKLGCKSRSTITNTAAWKQLVVARESARLQKAEQAYDKNLDKRRRPKRKQRPDRLGD